MKLKRLLVCCALCVICLAAIYWLNFEIPWNLQQRHSQTLVCPKLHFSRRHLPATALASFPGSGNTWTRHLIQQATGVYTGSVYSDKVLVKEGFPGEGLTNGSVIVIKTHWNFENHEIGKFTRAILIIRNPFEAIVSEYNRRQTQSHTGIAPASAFEDDMWRTFARRSLKKWRSFNLSWLRYFNGPIHVTFYDDLKTYTRGELDRITQFLHVVNFVECALQKSQGKFLRKKKNITDYDELFDKQLTAKSEHDIHEVYIEAFLRGRVSNKARS
ncbi:WSC domain-containing protein 2 [Lamellibrachia satsuma]|nr:WSC domain-containing protein 2 [Lamellibrachia satsuma]